MATTVHVRSVAGERFTQEVRADHHALFADEPQASGGSDRGPGPYDFLLIALGT